MRIQKKNMARLASISALGAGALGVAGTAEASTITYTPLNGKVGFSAGYGSSFHASIVPGILASIRRSIFGTVPNYFGEVGLRASIASAIAFSSGFIAFKRANAAAGQKWSNFQSQTVFASRTNALLGFRTVSGSNVTTSGANGSFYRLFFFQTSASASPEYGWIAFHQTLNPSAGPDVNILGFAFDRSGAELGAGDTGGASPEPSTAALSSLAALALGANGLRRWRASRQKQS